MSTGQPGIQNEARFQHPLASLKGQETSQSLNSSWASLKWSRLAALFLKQPQRQLHGNTVYCEKAKFSLLILDKDGKPGTSKSTKAVFVTACHGPCLPQMPFLAPSVSRSFPPQPNDQTRAAVCCSLNKCSAGQRRRLTVFPLPSDRWGCRRESSRQSFQKKGRN